jgi:4-carboxymuconolactone decarboxylase
MSRLVAKRRDELNEAQQQQYDRISRFRTPRADGSFGGPFDPWVRSPELAQRAVSFGNFIWERTTLDRRLVELAIIVTARFWQSNVEWVSHSRAAREHGVSDEVIAAVFEGRQPAGVPGDELAIIDACRALHETHHIPDDVYARAVALFGEQGVIEMVATIGYYTLVAMTLHAFEVQPPAGTARPFGE